MNPESPPAFLHPFARPAAPASSFRTIVRGHGALVYDDAGREYVDAMASLWYCAAGHGRTSIIDAVATQMRTLEAFHAFDMFTTVPAEDLAEQVAALAPVPRSRVFLTSGGSESVETAVKLSRAAHVATGQPQRTVVVARTPSYHGVAYAGTTLTGLPANQDGFGPLLPDVVHVGKDDLEAVERLVAQRGDQIAAIIAEPVVGAAGVYPPAPGYLAGLRALADQAGAHLILDEVITGFGRLGTWFAAEHYGVLPDMITFAKAITSGYLPLGGVVVAPRVHEALAWDPGYVLRHGYTYSGHPTAAAAALANLALLREEGLVARAPVVGRRLSDGLRELMTEGLLAEVRGDGAVWAAGLPPGVDPAVVRDRMLEHGVIIRPIAPSTVAYCPPLVITDSQIDRVVAATREALSG
ncbi:MAG: aminotransferase family protein [Actinomycetes bacterium]